MKYSSCFFGKDIKELIRYNIQKNKAAAHAAARYIEETESWMKLSYGELARLVFSPDIPRSWFVLSDGNCPSCGKSVPMYNWKSDPVKNPWKMICPHCGTCFPSNDFGSFYESGLDGDGRFRYERADRKLLAATDGGKVIDDGGGWYDENGRRYMFIGAYLCHVQWSGLVVKGTTKLAFSYILSGNVEYARRAAVLLDAIAGFWPEYDFYTQGLMYEQSNKSHGYVNYWVNSNREARLFALAYDQIYEAIGSDARLYEITGRDADEIRMSIENRILRDSLANMDKINTNPPETPLTVAILRSVLEFEENKKDIIDYIDDIIKKATSVDGLSGESGIGGYAAITPRAIADLLCIFSNTDENFLMDALGRHPVLYKTYRFHIDTWYDTKFYPGVGDSSVFALPFEQYTALFSTFAPLSSVFHRSREWFAMQLSEFFDDPDFAKTIYFSHGRKAKGCFDHDFYISDPTEYEKNLVNIIEQTGDCLRQQSINYGQWRISLLHLDRTMLAMPYSSGANHCHHDALSLHLFHKGMNITADFGYPPVNHGGWDTKEAHWYKQPSAHNMVVVDGKMHTNLPPSGEGLFYRYPAYGRNILFCSGKFAKAAYNDAREYADCDRFERFSCIVSDPSTDSYCVDIFRTKGGVMHSRFQRSTYSELSCPGLRLKPGKPYDPDKTVMRKFLTDDSPPRNWYADFRIKDPNSVLDKPADLHLRYTPLTEGVSVTTCESWVDVTRMSQAFGKRTGNREVWIPTLIEEKAGGISQFSGILEMYEGTPFIESARRIGGNGRFTEAIEVRHSGFTDVILVNDPENPELMRLKEYDIETDGLFTIVRFDKNNEIESCVCTGKFLTVNGRKTTAADGNEKMEFI